MKNPSLTPEFNSYLHAKGQSVSTCAQHVLVPDHVDLHLLDFVPKHGPLVPVELFVSLQSFLQDFPGESWQKGNVTHCMHDNLITTTE